MPPSGPDDPYITLIESTPIINGRYHQPKALRSAIREGHFSLLFVARDGKNGQDVVLKFFHPRHNNDSYRRHSFSREARLLSEFRGQPNILQLLEEEQQFEVPLKTEQGITVPFPLSFFVTELAPASVKDYIYSDANNAKDSLLLFREICKGLQRIHRKNMVHRDLKPGNALLFAHSVVKLCDFGTARKLDTDSLVPRYDRPVGDTRYTALELFCGMGNNPYFFFGADFFSLGAILFELFTRQMLTSLVYDGAVLEDLLEFFTRHVQDHQRTKQLDTLLPRVLTTWKLPDLYMVENLAPPSIRNRLDLFYKRLAELDYRNRAQIRFEWIFQEIEILLKILTHEEKYRSWLELKRRRRENEKRKRVTL